MINDEDRNASNDKEIRQANGVSNSDIEVDREMERNLQRLIPAESDIDAYELVFEAGRQVGEEEARKQLGIQPAGKPTASRRSVSSHLWTSMASVAASIMVFAVLTSSGLIRSPSSTQLVDEGDTVSDSTQSSERSIQDRWAHSSNNNFDGSDARVFEVRLGYREAWRQQLIGSSALRDRSDEPDEDSSGDPSTSVNESENPESSTDQPLPYRRRLDRWLTEATSL